MHIFYSAEQFSDLTFQNCGIKCANTFTSTWKQSSAFVTFDWTNWVSESVNFHSEWGSLEWCITLFGILVFIIMQKRLTKTRSRTGELRFAATGTCRSGYCPLAYFCHQQEHLLWCFFTKLNKCLLIQIRHTILVANIRLISGGCHTH